MERERAKRSAIIPVTQPTCGKPASFDASDMYIGFRKATTAGWQQQQHKPPSPPPSLPPRPPPSHQKQRQRQQLSPPLQQPVASFNAARQMRSKTSDALCGDVIRGCMQGGTAGEQQQQQQQQQQQRMTRGLKRGSKSRSRGRTTEERGGAIHSESAGERSR